MDKEKLNKNDDCGCDDLNCGCEDSSCGCGDSDCGCGDHEAIMVDLEDENGNIVPCEVVDGFQYKENDYAIVQNPENKSIYLFKIVGEGDEGELVIPDDDEFEEVSAYYDELTSDK